MTETTTRKKAKRAAAPRPRVFPFAAGTGYKRKDMERAQVALNVYAALWRSVQLGELQPSDLKDLFFKSICDRVTYRESWRAGKYWSKDAWERACKHGTTNKIGLVSEHVVPRGALLEASLKLPLEQAKQLVWDLSIECMVTEEENLLLEKAGLKSTPFLDNPFERYRLAGITILDVHHPAGVPFLSDTERGILKSLGILAEHKTKDCSCSHCEA